MFVFVSCFSAGAPPSIVDESGNHLDEATAAAADEAETAAGNEVVYEETEVPVDEATAAAAAAGDESVAEAVEEQQAASFIETEYRPWNRHHDLTRRERELDVRMSRPDSTRLNNIKTIRPSSDKINARKVYRAVLQQVYSWFSNHCIRRMPFAYIPYCKDMLKHYRTIAQGLQYGDKAEQVCMLNDWCGPHSYLQKSATTHVRHVREAGDAQ